MKISVVIPVYNGAEWLPEAIQSVLDQTKKPHEIIVVNDGSTDNSLEVAKQYPVKVINQINKGLSSARNTGIMNMTGDYFFPLDADDILLEMALEKIDRIAESHQPDVIAPSFKTFGVQERLVILDAMPSVNDFMTANRIGYFSAIKKEVLLEVGGYNPKMTWGYEDYSNWIDIFRRGHTLAVIPEILVLYRTKENSMLTEAQKHHDELMARMRNDFKELPWP